MIDIQPFSSADECLLTPSVVFGAIKCGNCDQDHGHFLSIGFLFWGLEIVWMREEAE